MKKLIVTGAVALITLSSVSVFAQTMPGQGSLVQNSQITVSGNHATAITTTGADVGVSTLGGAGTSVDVKASTKANVNSVEIEKSMVKDSQITVSDNQATAVTTTGGATVNVNSAYIH